MAGSSPLPTGPGPALPTSGWRCEEGLYIEAKMNDIPVSDEIIFSLRAKEPFFSGDMLGATG